MGTHPIFESDFDCLTERTEMEQDSTESRLTVDMGPETLDRVPEYRLKKTKTVSSTEKKGERAGQTSKDKESDSNNSIQESGTLSQSSEKKSGRQYQSSSQSKKADNECTQGIDETGGRCQVGLCRESENC